jgi:hypothetical protein
MGKRYSIAIGINDYEGHEELDFCLKDSEDITTAFIDFCNVQKKNTRFVKSSKQQPQRDPWEDFCAIIEDLKSEFVEKEDDLFFYFSGHGAVAATTTVIFKNKSKTIEDIISKIDSLIPRSKILIFDSCHSGAGFEDKARSAADFTHANKITSGYSILCACTKDQKSKESRELENGRFTRFLINVIAEKRNYNKYGILDINTVFSKVNSFLEDPSFKQNPFQQIRSEGIYPFANSFNEESNYSKFDVTDADDVDWSDFASSLNAYLNNKENIKGEFILLLREMLSNISDSKKGNADKISVSVTKNKVCLIDNGNFFDLMIPHPEVKGFGGTITASRFAKEFKDEYSYTAEKINDHNHYTFIFDELALTDSCSMRIPLYQISRVLEERIVIPEGCEDYSIRFDRRAIHTSFGHMFVRKLGDIGKEHNKRIYMEFAEGDWVGKEVERFIPMFGVEDFVTVRYYKD